MKATYNIWVTEHSDIGPQHIYAKERNIEYLLRGLHLSTSEGMEDYGWTLVGTANVIFDFVPADVMVGNKIKATRAKAQREVDKLEDELKSLLAISHEVQS